MAFLRLNTGVQMPALGIGTWHHGGPEAKREMAEAVRVAVEDIGFRHVDCAHIYLNEAEIGDVLNDLFKREVVKRGDLFIASKLWCTHHKPEHVEEALALTLKRLRLDYLDLYYMHFPVAFEYQGQDVNLPEDDEGRIKMTEDDYVDTWKAMEALQEKGLVKAIGICNFNSLQIKRLVKESKTIPAALQIESNPRMQNDILRRLCHKMGIVKVGYSPFGSPDLPWGEKMPHLLLDETLNKIATKHKTTPARVILKWQLQRGVAVTPKSVFKNELEDNFKVLQDADLDEDDLKAVEKLERNARKLHQVKKLKNGEIVSRDEKSIFYPFKHIETEDALDF